MQSKSDYDNAKLQGRNAGQTWIDQGNNAKDPKIKDAAYFMLKNTIFQDNLELIL